MFITGPKVFWGKLLQILAYRASYLFPSSALSLIRSFYSALILVPIHRLPSLFEIIYLDNPSTFVFYILSPSRDAKIEFKRSAKQVTLA